MKPQSAGGERAHGAVGAVEHAHGADRLGHLLAVGADVLDRRGADRARDAGQALDAGQAAGHAVGHERVPRLAGGDLERWRPSRATPRVAMRTTVPGEALVGDDDVRAAGEHEQRLAGPVGRGRRPRSTRLLARAPRRSGPRGRRGAGSSGRSGARRLRVGIRAPRRRTQPDAPARTVASAPPARPRRRAALRMRPGAAGRRLAVAARLAPGGGRPGQRHRAERHRGPARARGPRGRRARHDHPARAPRPAAHGGRAVSRSIMAVDAHADFPHGLRIVVHEHVAVAALAAGHRSRARRRRRHPAARQLDAAACRSSPWPLRPPATRSATSAPLRAVALLAAAPPELRAKVSRVYAGPRGLTAPLARRPGPLLRRRRPPARRSGRRRPACSPTAARRARPTSTCACPSARPRAASRTRRRRAEQPDADQPAGRRAARAAPDQPHDPTHRWDHDLTLDLWSRVVSTANLLHNLRVPETARNLAALDFALTRLDARAYRACAHRHDRGRAKPSTLDRGSVGTSWKAAAAISRSSRSSASAAAAPTRSTGWSTRACAGSSSSRPTPTPRRCRCATPTSSSTSATT